MSTRTNTDGPGKKADTYASLGFDSTYINVTLPTMETELCWRTQSAMAETSCNMATPGNITLEISVGMLNGSTALVVGTKRRDYRSIPIRSGIDGIGVSL
jgi:hypothetical protein